MEIGKEFQMLKKLIGFISLFVLLFCIKSICMASSDISVEVDETKIVFDQDPVIDNGRTLIPLRGVFDKLNCSVEWNGAEKKVTIKKGNDNVTLKIGENTVYKNASIAAKIDVPAKIINGRTMIPVRGVFELFDNYVLWKQDTRTVQIYGSYGNSVDIDLKKLEETNKALKMLENSSNIKTTSVYSDNKTEVFYSKENDGNLNVHVIDNNFESCWNNKKYYEKRGENNIYEMIYSNLISKKSLENYFPENLSISWNYNPNEKIVFAYEKNNKYYVKTEISDLSLLGEDWMKSFGIENNGKCVSRFIIDSDTFEILSCDSYQIIDGIEKNIMSLKIEKNVNEYNKFVQSMRESEKCNVNFNIKDLDSGLDEHIENVQINKGSYFQFLGFDSKNYSIYENEECTKLYDFNKKIMENLTINLYLKKITT